MPLPDERPRQSVANLIGRFENQTKRQPPSASRSSSVVSHTTGDSATAEAKEKREWPPKSVTEAATAPVVSPPSSFRFKSPETQPEPLPATIEPPTPTEPTTNGTSKPKPEVPEAPTEPAPIQPGPEVKDKPVAPKSSPSQTRTPSKVATTPRHSTAPKTAARSTSVTRTPAKPATASPSSPPTQTLKPQLTGRSSIGKSTVKPTPATPARPKTPSRTTNVTPLRSSGLYAPTAASLARARGAPSPAPTPPKKVVNSNSLDRLSKPTAASLSRARSPAVAQPTKPATTTRTVTSPKSAPRGTLGSGGKAPVTPSKKKAEETPLPTSPEVVVAATTEALTLEAEGDVFSATETIKEEKPVEEVLQPIEPAGEILQPIEPAEEISQPIEPEAAAEVSTVEEDQPDDSTVVESEAKVVVSEDEVTTQDKGAESPPPQADPEPEHDESLSGSASAAEDTDPVTDKLAALAAKHDGADIEQIVNLLETVPTTRAASDIISTPSDMQEIPDED